MRSYCIKEKKQTDCAPGSERYERAKNGRLMLKCQCLSCGITKTSKTHKKVVLSIFTKQFVGFRNRKRVSLYLVTITQDHTTP